MEEEQLRPGERVWFHDQRSPDRRMAVTSHRDEGLVVISLWRGDTCTGTFRLRLADAASLVAALASALAQGLPVAGPAAPTKRADERGYLWVVPDSPGRIGE
ncbi:MAG TPA: hypothetical protein VKU86_10125 [Acidimicrobiales bacterium]|nr:hypothetical protein [Acidimicrobiales bacterium]